MVLRRADMYMLGPKSVPNMSPGDPGDNTDVGLYFPDCLPEQHGPANRLHLYCHRDP